jgi:hypothetical protein
MLVNLGAGDEGLARGFQAWERAGREGRTMFRWSLDGSTIELPARVQAEAMRLRVRLARFVATPVTLVWRVDGREAARQIVRPGGWRVETVELGSMGGPLAIEIRSPESPETVGAAIDWIEIEGARRIVPRRQAVVGLLLLALLVPAIGHFVAGERAAQALGFSLVVALPAILWIDPGQGLETLAAAAPVVLAALLVLAVVSRARPELHDAYPVAAVAVTLVALALAHPAFFYPDVDTHARLLSAIRNDPALILDPSPFQAQTGAWMRSIAGAKVAFPYSTVFHVVAWPFALVLGETAAVKLLAVVAFGTSALLVHVLARAFGLDTSWAVLAQILFVFVPVESSRLCLALFPTLFGQALELTLVAILALAPGPREGRWTLALGGLLLVVQIAYTGSLVNVAAVVAVLAALEAIGGDRAKATRLLMALAASTAAVVGLLYARFVPVLWTHVAATPSGGGDGPDLATRTFGRLAQFYGPYVILAGFGWRSTPPSPAGRVLRATTIAGGLLLALRGPLPALARDFKDVELLAAPLVVFSAAALAHAARPGAARAGRVGAALLIAALVGWGGWRAGQAYAADVMVEGRDARP